jgi:hypothetical protein
VSVVLAVPAIKDDFSSFFFLKNFNMHRILKGKGKPDFKP